jgi:hypothetical protein
VRWVVPQWEWEVLTVDRGQRRAGVRPGKPTTTRRIGGEPPLVLSSEFGNGNGGALGCGPVYVLSITRHLQATAVPSSEQLYSSSATPAPLAAIGHVVRCRCRWCILRAYAVAPTPTHPPPPREPPVCFVPAPVPAPCPLPSLGANFKLSG